MIASIRFRPSVRAVLKEQESCFWICFVLCFIPKARGVSKLSLWFMNAGFRPRVVFVSHVAYLNVHWPLSRKNSHLDESNPLDNCHSNIRQGNSGRLVFSLSAVRQRYNKTETWAIRKYELLSCLKIRLKITRERISSRHHIMKEIYHFNMCMLVL